MKTRTPPRTVGTVEITRDRMYPVDPDRDTLDGQALVEPGHYPLRHDPQADAYWFDLAGTTLGIDIQTTALGDGMFTLDHHLTRTDAEVAFRSDLFTAVELFALCDPRATDGALRVCWAEQRRVSP